MTVTDWLLDSDPAVRAQVLRDLTDATPAEVASERAAITARGWGAELLAARDADGQWAGGACFPHDFRGDFAGGQPWTATMPTLRLLRELWVDPADPSVVETIRLVAENCRWEYDGSRFFDGEVEPCINGQTVAIGAYFAVPVDGIVARLLGEQLADGGWNCEVENGSVRSSFNTTMCVLEGLLAVEQATGGTPELTAARRSGEEYLLSRNLFRRASSGEVVDPDFLEFAFPTQWHYDVLRGLDYFRAAGGRPDPRLDEAIEMVRSKRDGDGRWPAERTHRGAAHLILDDGIGRPSRWNTLRALRVLAWAERTPETPGAPASGVSVGTAATTGTAGPAGPAPAG